MPWRIGTVIIEGNVPIICHVHGDVPRGSEVRIINRLDKSGQGVLMALPKEDTPAMDDDPQLRELTCDPKYRRILLTDGRSSDAIAIATALSAAGAATIFVGESEAWRPYPGRAALLAINNVVLVPLDVTDEKSVRELAGEIGGKTDILVNNARFVRPGGILDRVDTVFARSEMEVNYLGLMRLAQAFGPAMRGRGADGTNSAAAWVNIISVYAYSNHPAFGSFSASSAAAFSLTQCLRAELRPGGIRVFNLYVGPTDDEWHQPLPPPKVAPAALAKALVAGLQDGLEDAYVGDVARDLIDRWRAGPKLLEREMTGSTGDVE
ncbi:MAG: short-chain dehydrogenase [Pelagibacterium sp. SCN 63-23]|nr:MAG: short-chain dehydrogenase [Pelagibacterium sp. SCN 63-23]